MRMLVALIAVSVLALVGASPAMADENNCPGGSIIGGSHDDVKILGGTSCFISGATIGGNIQAESGHGFIRIRGGTVGGDVQIKGGTGFSFCAFTTIGGNFQGEENSGLVQPEFPIWNSDSNMVLALFS